MSSLWSCALDRQKGLPGMPQLPKEMGSEGWDIRFQRVHLKRNFISKDARFDGGHRASFYFYAVFSNFIRRRERQSDATTAIVRMLAMTASDKPTGTL